MIINPCKAEELFPQYAGQGNPYRLLAKIYLDSQRDTEALAQLEKWIGQDDSAREPLLEAADIYEKKQDWDSVSRMLDLSVYIHPYDEEIYKRLGKASIEAEKWDLAVAAYQALVGLNTTDPAGAHFDLATALFAAGDRGAAKREVLRSLEIAPSYLKAQQLLLKLKGTSDNGNTDRR